MDFEQGKLLMNLNKVTKENSLIVKKHSKKLLVLKLPNPTLSKRAQNKLKND